jgi:hypothetical protein
VSDARTATDECHPESAGESRVSICHPDRDRLVAGAVVADPFALKLDAELDIVLSGDAEDGVDALFLETACERAVKTRGQGQLGA